MGVLTPPLIKARSGETSIHGGLTNSRLFANPFFSHLGDLDELEKGVQETRIGMGQSYP
jgi:hypothetical protein